MHQPFIKCLFCEIPVQILGNAVMMSDLHVWLKRIEDRHEHIQLLESIDPLL